MPLGLAIVGPGAIAIEHLRAFTRLGDVDNVWVIGRTASSAASFADEWGFRQSGADLADALSDGDVDVVLICSPNTQHAAQAELALRAGKHVIVEIPLAMSRGEAHSLVALARQAGLTLQVCHTMRSFAGIQHVRDLVTSGEHVSLVAGFFGIPRRDNQGFRGTRTWLDDLLWHHACHLIDASLWVTGNDQITDPRLARGREHLGMTMDISLSFSTPSDQLVCHALTYNTAELVWQMRFVCDSGQYLFDNGRLFDGTGAIIVDGNSIRDLTVQNRALLEAIRSGIPGDFDAQSVLPSMDGIDQLEQRESRTDNTTLEWQE